MIRSDYVSHANWCTIRWFRGQLFTRVANDSIGFQNCRALPVISEPDDGLQLNVPVFIGQLLQSADGECRDGHVRPFGVQEAIGGFLGGTGGNASGFRQLDSKNAEYCRENTAMIAVEKAVISSR